LFFFFYSKFYLTLSKLQVKLKSVSKEARIPLVKRDIYKNILLSLIQLAQVLLSLA